MIPLKEHVENLLEHQKTVLAPYRDSWFPSPDQFGAIDRPTVEASVAKIYQAIGKEPPCFIWCKSPWQAVVASILLRVMAAGDDAWRKKLEESLVEPSWRHCYSILFGQLESYERVTDDQLRKPWFESQISSDELYRRLLLPCDTAIRETLGQRLYQHLRSILAVSLPQPDRPRNLAEWTHRPRRQLQIYLQSLSRFALINLEFGHFSLPRPDHDDFENAVSEPTFIEDKLIEQLPESLIVPLTKRLRLSTRDKSNYAHDDCIAALSRYFPHVLTTAISALQWEFPPEGMLPFYSFPIDFIEGEFYEPKSEAAIKAWKKLLANNVHHLFFDQCCILIDKPVVFETDERGRLHCEDGPAIRYSDGFEMYSWHGVTVEDRVILNPGSISCKCIDSEENAEVRRILMEKYGQSRYLQESGAIAIHEDEFGTLFRKELENDEPLLMVRVTNSTSEPDGTFKQYFLRVPPWVTTAKRAVAWTFNVMEHEYEPFKES